MAKNITIIDVAREAGVSISTVSRVMNGQDRVDEEMAIRVRAAAAALRYIPNANARSIRGKQEKTLGVILPSCADNFFSKLLEGILTKADEMGIRVSVFSCHGHGDPQQELDRVKTAAAASLSGLLYCPSAAVPPEAVTDLLPHEFPMVILYRRNMVPGVPHIYHDNHQGGYLATKYLLRLGRKKIAFFASFWRAPAQDGEGLIALANHPSRGVYSSLDRLDGHIRALEEGGISFDPALVQVTEFGYENGYAAAKEFLSKLEDFDAVVCANDTVASGILQALREQNISVPEQVSIVGYDDSVLATIARPMLTSVRQEPELLGRGAVEMITDLLEGKPVEDRVVEVQLVVRNSTSAKSESK